MESSDLFGNGHFILSNLFLFFCFILVENYLPALHFYVLSSISIIFVHIKKNKNLIFLPFNQEEGKMTEGVCIF